MRRGIVVAILCAVLVGCGGKSQTPYEATNTAQVGATAVMSKKIAERAYDHCLVSHIGSTSGVSYRGDAVFVTYSYNSYDRC